MWIWVFYLVDFKNFPSLFRTPCQHEGELSQNADPHQLLQNVVRLLNVDLNKKNLETTKFDYVIRQSSKFFLFKWTDYAHKLKNGKIV